MKIAQDYPSKFPTLAKVRTHYGSQAVEGIIKLYLIEITELVNLKRSLTEKQIETIALEVVTRYYTLTIADIHLLFRKAMAGEYGDFYESLDMPKVMKWFERYFDERCDIGATESVAQQFSGGSDPRSSLLAKREFDKLEAKLLLKKK